MITISMIMCIYIYREREKDVSTGICVFVLSIRVSPPRRGGRRAARAAGGRAAARGRSLGDDYYYYYYYYYYWRSLRDSKSTVRGYCLDIPRFEESLNK